MTETTHTAGERIAKFLQEHPEEAQRIAFSAVSGLYLDDDNDTARPKHDSYPRGSGSDYVDHVGAAVDRAGLIPLIITLQAEVEDV